MAARPSASVAARPSWLLASVLACARAAYEPTPADEVTPAGEAPLADEPPHTGGMRVAVVTLVAEGGAAAAAACSLRLRASRSCMHDASLQRLRRLPCWQMLPPPHSLHRLRARPCSQMLPPPHSLHIARLRPCSQYSLPAVHACMGQCMIMHARSTPTCSHRVQPQSATVRAASVGRCSDGTAIRQRCVRAPPHCLHLLRTLSCGHCRQCVGMSVCAQASVSSGSG